MLKNLLKDLLKDPLKDPLKGLPHGWPKEMGMPEVLNRVEESLVAVLTLIEGLEEADLSRSRLTRQEVRRHLLEAAAALHEAAGAQHAHLHELDFPLWAERAKALTAESREAQDAALWTLVRSQVPQTIGWLRIYRSQNPELFTGAAR